MGSFLGETILWRPKNGFPQTPFQESHRENAVYLTLSGEYPVLHTAEKARSVLYNGEKLFIAQRKEKASARKKADKQTETRQDLFDHLRAVRLELAKREQVPAYVVLSNASLLDMAQKLPPTRQDLLNMSGIGEVKAQRYGDVFLKAIRDWEMR